MTVTTKWIQPIQFDPGTWNWCGTFAWGRREIRVFCKYFGKRQVAAGAHPPDAVRRQVEERIAAAIANHERDSEIAAGPLANLYNAHWRTGSARKTSSGSLLKRLKWQSLFLDQGETRDQYRLVYEKLDLFSGYEPYTQFDLGKVCSIGVASPLGLDGGPLLPYPGVDRAQAGIPSSQSERTQMQGPNTRAKTAKINWSQTLSFDKRRKVWLGQIKVRVRTIDIVVNAPKSAAPPHWAASRLRTILPQLKSAMSAAVAQLTELYNESWVEERELSSTAVRRRIKLDSIEYSDDDEWSLWFNDGDLFEGHLIRADVQSSGEVDCQLLG